jgi:hypothetical protein
MGSRSTLLGKAIIEAIVSDSEDDRGSLLSRIFAFFRIFSITLSRFRADVFQRLRGETWQIDETKYRESFKEDSKNGLKSVGDLGYSGSVSLVFKVRSTKY